MAAASLGEEPRHERDARGTTGVPPVAYPLWDGKESVAQYARRVNLPETQTLDLGGGVTLELVLIPAGKFIMGTPEPPPVDEDAFHKKIVTGQGVLAAGGGILLVLLGGAVLRAIRKKRRFQYSLLEFMGMMFAASLCVLGGMHWWHSKRGLDDGLAEYSAELARYKRAWRRERRTHEVTITKPFFMGKYEVTQEQYQQVVGTNRSHFTGPSLPVENVSWNDAKEFCKIASGILGRDREAMVRSLADAHGSEFRLPTAAEWEHACRAGTATTYYSGDQEADLARVAWYSANSGNSSHPVGQKEPNAWGLYDMHGNVWEWCEDWFADYAIGEATDPKGPQDGKYRVLRGGSLFVSGGYCRAILHNCYNPRDREIDHGFRVVLAGPP